MARTDLIADMLTMVRNAIMAKKESVVVPASKMNNAIIDIMRAYGYIENYRLQATAGAASTLKVYLKYKADKSPALRGLKRISRPGLRNYAKCKKMPRVLRGYGMAIVSTSKGVMSGEKAREQKLGGEVVCYIW